MEADDEEEEAEAEAEEEEDDEEEEEEEEEVEEVCAWPPRHDRILALTEARAPLRLPMLR